MFEDPLKLFVFEYSVTQNASHVRTLGAVLNNNRRNLAKGAASDYVPVGLFRTREEVDKFELDFRRTLAQDAQLQFTSRNWHSVAEILERLLPRDLNFATKSTSASPD